MCFLVYLKKRELQDRNSGSKGEYLEVYMPGELTKKYTALWGRCMDKSFFNLFIRIVTIYAHGYMHTFENIITNLY